MDLKAYFQQLRETEATIAEDDVVVISNATSDGGKAGMRTEVSRSTAAKLIVEGKARLATAEESAAYRNELREARERAEQAASAARMQFTVLSESEVRALRERPRPVKG